MAEKHKVKISLLGGMKEYEIEVDDKKKFMKEIEDLIKKAHQNAKIQIKEKTSEEISKATGGFGIPGFKLPL